MRLLDPEVLAIVLSQPSNSNARVVLRLRRNKLALSFKNSARLKETDQATSCMYWRWIHAEQLR